MSSTGAHRKFCAEFGTEPLFGYYGRGVFKTSGTAMNPGAYVWTLIIYGVTAAIVYICYQLVAIEKLEAEKNATKQLYLARQADRTHLEAPKPKLPAIPVRTTGSVRTLSKLSFRLIR